MKTKKRLQALVLATTMLAALCGSFPAVSAETALPGPYRASEAYNDTSAAPKPWAWQYHKVSNDAYTTLKTLESKLTVSNKNYFTGNSYSATVEVDPAGDAWTFSSGIHPEVRVGKYWMATRMAGDAEAKKALYAVRTFTAPQTGNITISASDLNGNSVITGINKTTTALPLSVRIVWNDTKIWPQDKDWETVPKADVLPFKPICMNIEQNDKLYFEFADLNGSTGWDMAVYWDPVVTYNSSRPVESFAPSVLVNLPLDQTFTLNMTDAVTGAVTADNITIDGGAATVKSVLVANENKTISFSFDGLEFGKSYTVTIKDPADTTGVLYQFTFTTENALHASNTGTEDGTGAKDSPLTFQKALEQANNGEKIIVMDEIVLPSDFAWPTEKKHVTVSGGGEGAALNLYQLPNTRLEINTDATFENLVFASTETGDAKSAGRINAMGNVVTLDESVSTRGIFGSFYGGAALNWGKVDKTETYVYGGNFKNIYGGGGNVKGDCKLTVGGNTNTTAGVDPADERQNTFVPIIYGGTLDNTVDGDCITTITGNAAARTLYGGSLDDRKHPDRGAGVKGKTVLNIQGGKFMDVYGMNPPSSAQPGGTVDYLADVAINMTGGTVESLFGSSGDTNATAINASITINAMGGTVTRRIIGGVYNDLAKSGSRNSIVGTVAVRIGGGMKGLTDTQIGNGIIVGSRAETKPSNETATLIFQDGTYEKYQKNITHNIGRNNYSSGFGADWCDSNYDYLVTGTVGGTIVPADGNQITVTPDEGYEAYIGGESVQGNYALDSARTYVVFTNDGPPLIPAISGLSGTVTEDGVQATISYTAAADTNTLILALYENENLVAVAQPSVTQGIHANQAITIPYVPKNGETYTIKSFLWDGMVNIVPLCDGKSAEIPTVQ